MTLSSVIEWQWWRFIKQTSTGITSHPFIPHVSKYILVERKKARKIQKQASATGEKARYITR